MNEKLEDLKKWKYSLTIWESSNYCKNVTMNPDFIYISIEADGFVPKVFPISDFSKKQLLEIKEFMHIHNQ